MSYWRSPSWRLAYPWLMASPVVLTALAVGISVVWPPAAAADGVGLVALAIMLAGLLSESAARWRARRHGHRGWYALPAPWAWFLRRLRAQGNAGPIPGPIWELHVRDTERWRAATPQAAAALFRAALSADLAAWAAAVPPTVTLAVVTFNYPSARDRAVIAHAGGVVLAGPLVPAVARHFTARRMRRIQRWMFGGVVSTRSRTRPDQWSTWVLPARALYATSAQALPPGESVAPTPSAPAEALAEALRE